MVLTRVCPSINLSVHRGGYPYPIMLCNISQNAMRQRGGVWSGTPPGGTRSGTPLGGVPRPPGGLPRTPTPRGTRVRYPPGGYPGSTTEVVLTTRRAVCLLRSRRRTFLFRIILLTHHRMTFKYDFSLSNWFNNVDCTNDSKYFQTLRFFQLLAYAIPT